MLPSVEEAEQELQIAGELNPGPWTKHSLNVGIAACNIAQKLPHLDKEKAYIVGILHDIGRRVGIVNIPKHVYEGYAFCMEKGWDEVAKVCMTHSYVLMQEEFDYEPAVKEEIEIKKYIQSCQTDDYDLLIQLCDSLATDYGFVIIEKRFVDVTRRYGIMEKYIEGWNKTFEIKEYFEAKMGCSIYDVLPDIGRTTLLSPPPWKPPLKEKPFIGKLRNMTAIYLSYNGKMLLLYRQGSRVSDNVWIGSAGGHFEECELNDAKACVLRELEEELSVTEDMICNLKLRYVTLRRTKAEIRQNYYFFAELKSDIRKELSSNEGILKWFGLSEMKDLKMPFSAKFMMEHYLQIGMHNDKVYGGIADGEKVIFTELPEF